MKYICMNNNGVEEVFTFPSTIDHDAMEEVLSRIKNHTIGNWERVFRFPVSAGFVMNGKCFGRSETLDLDSREEIDTKILRGQ